MFTEFDRLSNNQLTRTLQLRNIALLESILEHVLLEPSKLDLVRVEKRLNDTLFFIGVDFYNPFSNNK